MNLLILSFPGPFVAIMPGWSGAGPNFKVLITSAVYTVPSVSRQPGSCRMDPSDLEQFRQARFLTSAPDLARSTPDTGAEVAFAGRSNAGKSSAINALTNQRKLARTSKTPGRTRLINFFDLGGNRRLVDLPGYGYARVAQSVKQEWQRNLAHYLEARQSLVGLVLLMDIRHPLQDSDRFLVGWAAAAELPVHAVLTKADKLRRGPALSVQIGRASRRGGGSG